MFFLIISCILVYDGSDDEVTECYVEEASPLVNSSPIVKAVKRTRRQGRVKKDSSTSLGVPGGDEKKTVAKEKSKAENNSDKRNSLRSHQDEHEFGLNMAKTPQVSQFIRCTSFLKILH